MSSAIKFESVPTADELTVAPLNVNSVCCLSVTWLPVTDLTKFLIWLP